MNSVLKPLYRAATRVISTSGRFVPYAAQKPLLALALNEAFQAPLERGDFEFLDGHRVRIRVTDLGADWPGGFFCPCHGSKFDLAGRVYKSVPAPTNMVVPPHVYLSDNVLLIGAESKESA